MTTNACPACGREIPADDVNVKEGAALCRACGKLSRLAEVVSQPVVSDQTLTAPPGGCSYHDDGAGAAVLRASLRSPGRAVGALFVCLFWNGIVSVFVLVAIAGLYTNLVGPLPSWAPAPKIKGGGTMGLGMTLGLCVFLIPFVLIGLAMLGAFLLSVAGRIEVVLSGGEARVRTGVGRLNWTRRFDPAKVKHVTEGETAWETNGRKSPLVAIVTEDKTVKFGSMLEDGRRQWLLGALHLLLVRRRGAAVQQQPPRRTGLIRDWGR